MAGTAKTDEAATLAASIHAADLKVTAPRLAVLKALTEHPHATAEQIFDAVSPELPATSKQAVYGVLAAFTAAHLVRKIEPAGSPARYERRIGDNHHHIVCTRCSAVGDVDCVIGAAPCLAPSDTGGFSIHTAEVTFWGLCPACRDALNAEADAETDVGDSVTQV